MSIKLPKKVLQNTSESAKQENEELLIIEDNDEHIAQQQSEKFQTAPMGAPLNDDTRAQRPKRVPVSQQYQRRLPQIERAGFRRRYVNIDGDRVEVAKQAGYTIVHEQAHSGRSKDPSIMGSEQRLSVGRGTTAVLMEIPEEWYNEDQLAKVQKNKEHIEGLMTPKEGQYAKAGHHIKKG